MNAWIVALDPGLNGCGVAWGTDGLLEYAGYVESPYNKEGAPAERGVEAGLRAAKLFLEHAPGPIEHVEIVVEVPQVYARKRGSKKVDPKWLIGLAACSGAFAGAISADLYPIPCRTKGPSPRGWKGTLDGDAKIEQIKEELNALEHLHTVLPIMSLAHNVYDACGLFLWAAGRLKKQRVIHR